MRRNTKVLLVRTVAVAIPTVLGLLAIGVLLFRQDRLTIEDGGDGALPSLRIQEPRIYLEEPGHELTGHRYLYDETLGWRNIPNWSATTYDRTLTINSRGLRDRERDLAKPEGMFRILVLGDSFTWGYGVSDEEIFTGRLEAGLRSNGRDVEVLNAGVSGWGTDQELLYLESEGLRYSPDLVVLAFFLYNDPDNIRHSVQYGLQKPLFADTNLTLVNVPVPKPGVAAEARQFDGNPLDLATALIARMAKRCREHNARFLVMKFGAYVFYEDQPGDLVDRKFRELIEPLQGVEYFDLDAAFRRLGIPVAKLKAGHSSHWDAEGHQLVADALAGRLAESGMLSGATTTTAPAPRTSGE